MTHAFEATTPPETASTVDARLLSDADAVALERLSAAGAPAAMITARNGDMLIGVRAETIGFGAPTDGDIRRALFGSIGFADSWAVTGRFSESTLAGEQGSVARLGVRYSTRAGEEFVIAVEPSVGIDQSGQFGDAKRSMLASLSLGATATYALSDHWYVSGIAQIDQYMGQEPEVGGFGLRNTGVIGGLVTGIRF